MSTNAIRQVGQNRGQTGQRRGRRWLFTTVAWISGVIVAVPFLWAVRSSLFPGAEALKFPPTWIPSSITDGHYSDVLTQQPFLRYVLNSILIGVAVAIGQVITASMAGYAFARLQFPGRGKLFLGYLATMMIPTQVTLIPQYLIVSRLGWIDSYQALIVPSLASAFSTFMMRQFILSIPRELEDAAKIDGAGYFAIYTTIIMPLCKPALSTVGLLAFMTSWTNFLWPLVVTNSSSHRTVPLGLAALQNQQGFTDFPQIMAGAVIGIAPMFIMFLALQRFVVAAVASSGLKG